MLTIPQLAQTLQTLLTTTADTAARATRFVQRRSKLTGAAFVQTLVFGFLANPQASRDALSQMAATLGVDITSQGLDQRCTPAAAACLQQVLAAAVQALLATAPAAIPLLDRFTGVYLLDSTVITLPPSLAANWLATGNQHTTTPTAALKLTVRWDLRHGALAGLDLLPGRTGERAAPQHHAAIPRGALRLADLGFFDLPTFAALAAADAYFLSRLRMGTAVYTPAGQRQELVTLLQQQGSAVVDLPVQVGVSERLACRLLAVRVPQEVVDQRRRRLQAEARKRGRAVPAEHLTLAAWTIYVTNAPAELLTVDEALVLGRARWQIELLFKLWKSHGQIDQWRSAKPDLILCELYAKLIGMVVQHWLVLVGCWQAPDRSLPKAAQTVRQYATSLARAINGQAALTEVLTALQRCLQRGCRINKRRTRPNTYQRLLDVTEAALG